MTSKTVIDAPEGQRYLTITRAFKAPAELVARAHIDTDLIAQWMGPHNLEMTVTDYEPRHGGKWAFTHKDPEGNEYAFRGVFHGDPSVDGIIRTFAFEMFPNDVCLESLTFAEENGSTTVHVMSVFLAQEARDGLVASGMETGVVEGYERLDTLLESLS